MRVGLYSTVARKPISRARESVLPLPCGAQAEDIKARRQQVTQAAAAGHFGELLNISDFFSLSGCRDLLFHTQEQSVTLDGVQVFLETNGLTFLGFDIGADVLRAYKQQFPTDMAVANLANWRAFEAANPATFLDMYQFWIQKPLDLAARSAG